MANALDHLEKSSARLLESLASVIIEENPVEPEKAEAVPALVPLASRLRNYQLTVRRVAQRLDRAAERVQL
jgi:hypothetical protein